MRLTAQAAGVSYIDGNGTPQNVDATELATDTTSWTDGSWYIVPEGGLTISGRITVNGTVNLILRDGATLTANAGITTTNATLNIYAQSGGTGALTATGSNGAKYSCAGGSAGIGGVSGGYVNGGVGGNVNIYGGTVTATGGDGDTCCGGGAGIGGGGAGDYKNGGAGGNVNIYGGTVTATGGISGGKGGGANGAGIGDGGKSMDGKAASTAGTLNLGPGVKLYDGTDNTGMVLDDSDSTERTYSGNRTKSMFAETVKKVKPAQTITSPTAATDLT